MASNIDNDQAAGNGGTATAVSGAEALAAPGTSGEAHVEKKATKIPQASDGMHKVPHERLLLKIDEAAALLSVSTSSIRRLISRGELAPNRKLRHVLIARTELERFANGGVR